MIDRLRTWARNGHTPKALADDLKDAADEIERQRLEIKRLMDTKTHMRKEFDQLIEQRNWAIEDHLAQIGRLRDEKAATIERCAQVAENTTYMSGAHIAAAIRALKK